MNKQVSLSDLNSLEDLCWVGFLIYTKWYFYIQNIKHRVGLLIFNHNNVDLIINEIYRFSMLSETPNRCGEICSSPF